MTIRKSNSLEKLVSTSKYSINDGAIRSKGLLNQLISESDRITKPNFDTLGPADLQRLFQLIDEHFLANQTSAAIAEGGHSLKFRISQRMTNSGGITTTQFPHGLNGPLDFEIAISATLLFESFRDQKPILVTGLLCGDRLQALKRIMEHEMIHLIEMLLWQNSNCQAKRFQGIARRLFSHKKSCHQLITPRETAAEKYQISAGDWVAFRFKGNQFLGVVNRITKRATVLVPSHSGTRYTDGKRYEKYYVPVASLKKVA